MGKELIGCPLCSSDKKILFDRRLVLNIPFNNRLCELCDMVFRSPHMSTNEANGFQKNQYRFLHQAGIGGVDTREIVSRHHLYTHVPNFTIGRPAWDNWMVFHASTNWRRAIDATRSVTLTRQFHDYRHLPGNRPTYGSEVAEGTLVRKPRN